MPEGHLGPHRGWELIRDEGTLAESEVSHLEECRACNTWLKSFVDLARKVGFHVPFEVPPYNLPDRKAA
jgi:hypothetical protein